MANSSTKSAKTKVIHAGFLLADPDIQPKSDQSILIEGERIKAVSDGFIDPPPGGELIDLRRNLSCRALSIARRNYRGSNRGWD